MHDCKLIPNSCSIILNPIEGCITRMLHGFLQSHKTTLICEASHISWSLWFCLSTCWSSNPCYVFTLTTCTRDVAAAERAARPWAWLKFSGEFSRYPSSMMRNSVCFIQKKFGERLRKLLVLTNGRNVKAIRVLKSRLSCQATRSTGTWLSGSHC